MNPDLWKKLLKLTFGFLVFILLLDQFLWWPAEEKPLPEQILVILTSAGGLGAAGAVLGFVIGGIGLALMGGAIGLAGWLVFGVLGFGAGALGGSLYTILNNHQNYDFNIFRLTVLLILIALSAHVAVLYASKIGRKILAYLERMI